MPATLQVVNNLCSINDEWNGTMYIHISPLKYKTKYYNVRKKKLAKEKNSQGKKLNKNIKHSVNISILKILIWFQDVNIFGLGVWVFTV